MRTKTDEKILLNLYKELGAKIALKRKRANKGKADKQTVNGMASKLSISDADSVNVKTKKDGSIKSVKISIGGKDYKAKKSEWSYDGGSGILSFSGENLAGSYKVAK